jgi:serine/threonine protein kinase
MSPQITAAKAQGKTLYDGTKADVWAMGVLLCVMLIGKFPFEGDSVSSMGVSDPMKKIWLQQNKCIWSDNAALKDQLEFLSKPALDLLGKMFELDEEKRIDVKGIKAHPWFSTPMRTEFQEAIEKMELSQTEVDNRAMIGAFRSKQRDDAISNLVKLSASDEFRKRAAEPINPDTVFQVWSRISLKTVLKSYPVFDKRSLRQMMSYTDGASTPSMRRDKTKKLAGTASVRG